MAAHRSLGRRHDDLYASKPEKRAASGPPEEMRKKSPGHQVPGRNSDVVVWHATHGLVPDAGAVTDVCANCQIEKTTLRKQAA